MEVNRGKKRDKEPFSGLINIIYQSFILIMPVLSKRGDISHKTQYIYMHIYNHPLYSKKKERKKNYAGSNNSSYLNFISSISFSNGKWNIQFIMPKKK